jgi:cytochrome oxidase Cu insertion factor (SCO1/SenC/PrrC family)
MIRVFILLLCITFIPIVKAQTPLEEAIDFQVTDVNGNEIHLFQLLDEEGKYVLIDFFFTTCGPCQDIVPRVSEAYEYFGCGEHDIEFIAMD